MVSQEQQAILVAGGRGLSAIDMLDRKMVDAGPRDHELIFHTPDIRGDERGSIHAPGGVFREHLIQGLARHAHVQPGAHAPDAVRAGERGDRGQVVGAVAVAVGEGRIGVIDSCFIVVGEPVAVGIREGGIRAKLVFLEVREPIAVRIFRCAVPEVAPIAKFPGVGQAVAVAVGVLVFIVEVGAHGRTVGIRQGPAIDQDFGHFALERIRATHGPVNPQHQAATRGDGTVGRIVGHQGVIGPEHRVRG